MRQNLIVTITFAFALLGFQTLRAQALTLDYFTAAASGTDVMVAWQLPEEAGVSQFKLYRKIDGETSYKLLTTVSPNGTKSYEYLDVSLFKDLAKVVNYQLQITRNGMVYSYYATIMYNPTSVQRTWGSIKAMFR